MKRFLLVLCVLVDGSAIACRKNPPAVVPEKEKARLRGLFFLVPGDA